MLCGLGLWPTFWVCDIEVTCLAMGVLTWWPPFLTCAVCVDLCHTWCVGWLVEQNFWHVCWSNVPYDYWLANYAGRGEWLGISDMVTAYKIKLTGYTLRAMFRYLVGGCHLGFWLWIYVVGYGLCLTWDLKKLWWHWWAPFAIATDLVITMLDMWCGINLSYWCIVCFQLYNHGLPYHGCVLPTWPMFFTFAHMSTDYLWGNWTLLLQYVWHKI